MNIPEAYRLIQDLAAILRQLLDQAGDPDPETLARAAALLARVEAAL
jgi:hypothetical protein